jgi:rifampicin phosphotransferase
MPENIVPLECGATAEVSLVGGKAHNLLRLANLGLPVPRGFVITTAAYQEKIPAALAEEIRGAYAVLGDGDVAVRSSGVTEDSEGASFAGGHETFLNVNGFEQVLASVEKCWGSMSADRVRAYRERMNVAEEKLTLAVIVQRMVRARTSGVVFTAEPVSGNREIIAIDACRGLGDALVSGQVVPEHFELRRRDLKVLKRTKQGGFLSKSQVTTIARCALEIEQKFGQPQDVEWSIDEDGELRILQSRPITTIGCDWENPVEGAIFVRRGGGGLVEYLPTAVSPLYATAQLPRIQFLLDAQCPEMGVVTPQPTMAVINGHFYSRQDYRVGWSAFKLPFAYWRAGRKAAPWWKREVLPRQMSTLAELERFDRTSASETELVGQLNKIFDFNAVVWDNAVRASRGWVALEPVFKHLFRRFVAPVTGGDAVAFLCGFESRVLAAEREQFRLVQAARSTPAVRRALVEQEGTAALDRLRKTPEGRAWLDQLLDFCESYGHVTPNQDYFCATAADDPAKALAAIRARLDLPDSDPTQRQERVTRERKQAEQAAFEKLAGRGMRRGIFKWSLEWAQEGASIREDVFFHALAGWPLARRTLVELGRRLARRGAIESAEDIFFVEWKEIGGSGDLRDRVKIRQEAFVRQAKLSPPPVVPLSGVPLTLGRRLKNLLKRVLFGSSRQSGRDFLRGSPVSPGRATGPARILSTAGDLGRLQAGDIVVTKNATPDWTPTFTVAAGLVTDTGGPLSHCSIIAREFGIPAVMGVETATDRIVDGQMITIDGTEGLIRLHVIAEP